MIDPIVSPGWLEQHLGDVVVCDVGTTMAGGDPHERYVAGHVAGARFVDLDETLADPPGGVDGRHPLPTPARFAEAMGSLGVGRDATVVAYDDRGGAFAARLVWMLRVIGQDAALLDGGLAAWTGPTETGPAEHGVASRPLVAWPQDALADADTVAAHVVDGGVLIDSREAPRYRGEVEPIDAVAGHVPGAINLPFADNVHDGRFRPAADLVRLFSDAAGDPAAIVYCGSGVTACHNALAMERAGLPRPRVYVGSWSGWSSDPGRSIAVGPDPG